MFQEPLRLQLKVFMEEVQQQKVLPTIRSYLKLYTTMPLDKMAGFMELQPEDFRDNLLAFKHKMKNVVWTKVMWSSVCVCSFYKYFLGRAPPAWRESSSLALKLISTLTRI